MRASEIIAATGRLGVDGVTGTPIAMRAGLGGNDLWRLPRDDGDLVLRLFPASAPIHIAEREEVAHRYARDNGVRAPRVITCDMLGARPALVMEWTDGTLVADVLRTTSSTSDDIGRRCGATLARLHRVSTAPPPMLADPDWVDWAGDRAVELRPLLSAYRDHRIVHMDFHPENLIVGPDGTITVLDWANVHIGPPQADIARTLSILDMAREPFFGLTDAERTALDVFRAGLLSGYANAGCRLDIPDEILAWACAVQLNDSVADVLPEWYLDRLRRRYGEHLDRA